MSSTVEQIKERLSITDVVASYMKLDPAGASLKARCPFHNEKTPSFFVSPHRGSYYCFGCGAKGDIFSFVEAFEGLDFKGALKVLAERAGVPLVYEKAGQSDDHQKLYDVLDLAMKFYETHLAAHPDARTYVKQRGLSDATIVSWHIGFAPDLWKGIFTELGKRGVSVADLVKTGVIKESEKTKGDYYDRFRSRIMFPLFDSAGRVIAFSGRIFGKEDDTAKYINSPETVLFDKSRTLYGLDRAKLDIRRRGYAILVEGQMDLLMCHQAGFTNTVAVSGTALSPRHLETLRRLSNRLMIAFDGDKAGIAASERGWQSALSLGMEVKICALPRGTDPAELIRTNPSSWVQALKDAKHIITFFLEHSVAEVPDKRSLGRVVQEKILPYVASLESAIETAHFVQQIRDATNIAEDALWEEVRKIRRRIAASGSESIESASAIPAAKDLYKKSRREILERSMLALYHRLVTVRVGEDVDHEIEERVNGLVGMIGGMEALGKIEATLEDEKEVIFLEAEIVERTPKDSLTMFAEVMSELKKEYLREQFNQLMKSLEQAEQSGNHEKAVELLIRCQEISKELEKSAGESLVKK